MARLHDLGQSAMGFDFLSCKNELVVNIEQYKQAADDQSPLRKQPQGKMKRDSAEETKEERRVAERCQQARGVADNEDKEDDEVSSMPPQMIRPQERPNQQHGCAGRPNQVRKKRSDSKKDRVDKRRSRKLSLHVNPAG